MPFRMLLLSMVLLLTQLGALAQPATPDMDDAVERHLAWVLDLFDGGAATLTEAEVEAHFDAGFLALVPPAEVVASVRALAEDLGPLELVERQESGEYELVGLFRSATGEGVIISFAVDPDSGLMTGFFITPAPLPAGSPTAGSPVARPPATPAVAASPVALDAEEQLTLYRERVEIVRAVGEPAVAALLAGDDDALRALVADDVAALMAQYPSAEVIESFTARQVQMVFAEAGAAFFGQWTDDRITGTMVQGGAPFPFTLTAEQPQTGDRPAGRFSGQIPQARVELAVTFATAPDGELAATLDIPAQGITDAPLSDVAYLPERPLGEMIEDRAIAPGGGNDSYTADYAWGDHYLRVTVAVDLDARLVSAVRVTPAVPLPPAGTPAEPVTAQLPFDGTWFVFWGGETELQNYHAATASQRYACDLMIWNDGATWSGDGAENADYWAWGQPVLAPVAGEVVAAVNDAEDVPPGRVVPTSNPGGNHVVIRVDDGVYVIVAHMQRGSVRVEEGEHVRAGDVIGLVGNSGSTSEPHVHIHAQDTPDLLDPAATGIPLRFEDIFIDGEPRKAAAPVQGSFVANP